LLTRVHPDQVRALVELGLQHEQQHQELILTDIQHLLSMNPLYPAYHSMQMRMRPALRPAPSAMEWISFEPQVIEIGHAQNGFCFDNETPRHRQFVESFDLASRLVTNEEFLAFVDAGGYRDPALWLSEGWDWIQAGCLEHPLYWRHHDREWHAFTLHGLQPLDRHAPACHLSFFEADAYARWSDARLPTEAEWEHAALVEQAAGGRLTQLFGAAWQWTSSSYAPYPGYRTAEGALGEYNGKFMADQYVLRGSSCATPDRHSRITYRNFFPSAARWQFSGIRLARSW
jgi:ergothioneine biosynthesis protein EgtB